MQGRRLWLQVHRWIGLALGLPWVLLGLTGSYLVYRVELDPWVNPAQSTCAGPAVPLAQVLDAARASAPGLRVRGIDVGLGHGLAEVFMVPATGAPTTLVRVDRGCARVLAIRPFDRTVNRVVTGLHGRLLASITGRYAVAALGIVLVASAVSGVVLWWPARTGRSTARRLHVWGGLAGAVPLLLVALSGVFLDVRPELQPALDAWSPPPGPPPGGLARDDEAALTIDEAVSTALAKLPGAVFLFAGTPRPGSPVFAIGVRQPHEPSLRNARSTVWVDAYTGAVLAVRDAHHVPALLAVQDWAYPVHDGQAFGRVGQAVWCLAGLLPSGFLLTGSLLWLRRRRAVILPRSPGLRPGERLTTEPS